jgi:hypothetical protein
MTSLLTIERNSDMWICSFYLEIVYTNISKRGMMNIINSMSVLENNPEINITVWYEISCIPKTVMEQNYFQFDQQYYNNTVRNPQHQYQPKHIYIAHDHKYIQSYGNSN